MATAQGFTEVFNYSFLSEDSAHVFGFDPADHMRVANPIASDQSLMRTSLLPGIFKNISENSRHFQGFRLFEIGREIQPGTGELPHETPHCMAAIFAREGDGSAGLFELKHLAECLAPGCETVMAAARSYEHPERTARITSRDEPIGRLLELHPSLGLEGRAAVLDLDLAALEHSQTSDVKVVALRRYPTSAFDVSVVTPLREPVTTTEAVIVPAAGPDLVSCEFVRQYVGPPLPEDRKSISFRVTVGASDHTLSAEEAGAIRARVIEALRDRGYDLRI
jgi:phenylalanyl-tRNA synthetase beta chain